MPWPIWLTGRTKTGKGSRALISSALAFSLMTVCVKHLNGRIPVAEIVLARACISLGITNIMLRKLKVSPWGKNKLLLVIRGLLGTVALFCVFKAIEELPLASATVIQYTYPTFTALAAWAFLKEKLRKRIITAVLIGWIGITLVVQQNWLGSAATNSIPLSGTSIGLTGSILTALAYVCVRKLSKKEHPMVIIYYFPLISIPITLPLIANQAVMPIGAEWLWILGIGLFTQLGQIWITEGLRLLPAAQASAINYVQVLFATLWGILIFGEAVNLSMILGALCVLIATLISLSSIDRTLRMS